MLLGMENNMLKIIFFILIPLILFAQGTLIFSDNFDDGDASGWSLNSAAISTDQAHSGLYSIKCTHSTTVAVIKIIDHATMLLYDTVTVKYQWFTAATWITGTGVKFCRLRAPSQVLQTELWWGELLGVEPRSLGGYMYGGQTVAPKSFYAGDQSYKRSEWMKIEIQYIYNTGTNLDGILKVLFDDTLRYNYSNVGWRNNSDIAYNYFYLPSNIGTSNANNINYIDDVEIWGGTAGQIAGSDTTFPSASVALTKVSGTSITYAVSNISTDIDTMLVKLGADTIYNEKNSTTALDTTLTGLSSGWNTFVTRLVDDSSNVTVRRDSLMLGIKKVATMISIVKRVP